MILSRRRFIIGKSSKSSWLIRYFKIHLNRNYLKNLQCMSYLSCLKDQPLFQKITLRTKSIRAYLLMKVKNKKKQAHLKTKTERSKANLSKNECTRYQGKTLKRMPNFKIISKKLKLNFNSLKSRQE